MKKEKTLNIILNTFYIFCNLIVGIIFFIIIFTDNVFSRINTLIYDFNTAIHSVSLVIFISVNILFFTIVPRFILRKILEKKFGIKLQKLKLGIFNR